MQPHDALAADGTVAPWSPEAETSVLGALMLNNDLFDEVGDTLEARHFHDPRNSKIFTTIAAQVISGKPADVVSVLVALQEAGHADIQLDYLNGISQVSFSLSSVKRYAEVVLERSMSRGLMDAAWEVRELAVTPGLDSAERLDQAQAKLQALAVNRGRQAPVAVGDMAAALCERVEQLSRGEIEPGIRTGIPGLDKRLNGGLRPGKLIILAARPAVGKSSLAMQIALNLAADGVGAGFLSQEMPKADLMDRIGANTGRIFLDNIITGQMRDQDWARLTAAIDRMVKLPLFLDDQPALTLADIQAKARALVRQHGIKLLVLDYIQLCGSRKTNDKRHHQIEEISRGLKALAKQLGITIIALSQLNRGLESRVGGKPQLSDLKESGAIEEDADVVMLLSLNHISSHGGKVVEVDFAKNRQGRVGSVPLAFDGAYQHWTDSAEPLSTPDPGRRKASHYTDDI